MLPLLLNGVRRPMPRGIQTSTFSSAIYNKSYNPSGKCKASEYRFPFKTASFDFVFLQLSSTHIPPRIENYFSEVVRVLKRHGRCLITYILLNPESLELIDGKVSPYLSSIVCHGVVWETPMMP